MVQFAEVFPTAKNVVTLSRQLGWSHFVALIPVGHSLKREFYAEMYRMERWNVRTLRKKIGGMLFERTALSKKPDKLKGYESLAIASYGPKSQARLLPLTKRLQKRAWHR